METHPSEANHREISTTHRSVLQLCNFRFQFALHLGMVESCPFILFQIGEIFNFELVRPAAIQQYFDFINFQQVAQCILIPGTRNRGELDIAGHVEGGARQEEWRNNTAGPHARFTNGLTNGHFPIDPRLTASSRNRTRERNGRSCTGRGRRSLQCPYRKDRLCKRERGFAALLLRQEGLAPLSRRNEAIPCLLPG